MSPPPDDARIDAIDGERIAALASLYDRFAHALDPFSEVRDQAELVFQKEVATLYDELDPPKPDFKAFQRAIILRCRRHLRASAKPSSI
jgi:hypothetical protein